MGEGGNERWTSAVQVGRVALRTGSVLGVVGGSLVAVAPTAGAAPGDTPTLLVTTTADDGAGSLRQALRDAVDGDIIGFDLPAGQDEITLTSGQLRVEDLVEINGPGSGSLTIDAGGSSRVFYLYSDVPGSTTISGLTATGGYTTGNGGGIHVDDTSEIALRLLDVVLDGNQAEGDGGGLHQAAGSLVLEDSTVSGNTALHGGGVMVDGRYAGAMGSVSIIDGTQLLDNTATDQGTETDSKYGGGGAMIMAVDGDVLVDDAVVQGNVAQQSKYGGIGISAVTGSVTISGGTQIGGADVSMDDIAPEGEEPTGPFVGGELGDANFGLGGGGLGITGVDGGVLVEQSRITGNYAGFGAGMKYSSVATWRGDTPYEGIGDGGLTILSSTLSGNAAAFGGGLSVAAGYAEIDRTSFERNEFKYGGGLFLAVGDVVAVDSTFAANVSSPSQSEGRIGGGGIAVVNGRTTLVNSTVSANVAAGTQSFGGGVAVGEQSEVELQNTTVTGNTATEGGGIATYGAIAGGGETASEVHLHNSIVGGNSATGTAYDSNDVAGTVEASYSLIEDDDDDGGLAVIIDSGGNLLGVSPRLGALALNGGTTRNHLPLVDSPVIDAGDPEAFAPTELDQRGADRVVGAAIDMGSVERQPGDPTGGGGGGGSAPPAEPAADEPPCEDAPGAGFTDVGDDNVHLAAVECLAHLGITEGGPGGLPADHYGPAMGVTRGQMASFLARLVTAAGVVLPEGEDAFDDDDGNTHEAAIDALAAAGIIEGTSTPGDYDPAGNVRRDQMASFLVRLAALLAEQGDFPVDEA